MHTSSTQGDARDVTQDMSYERERDWQSDAHKVRVDGTEKNASINEWNSCTFSVYWSIGCCISQSIAMSIPGTWRFEKYLFRRKKPHNSLRTAVHPESLKALSDDIQQERRVRQHHHIESSKSLNDGISTRRYVCQSLVGTTTTIYV